MINALTIMFSNLVVKKKLKEFSLKKKKYYLLIYIQCPPNILCVSKLNIKELIKLVHDLIYKLIIYKYYFNA